MRVQRQLGRDGALAEPKTPQDRRVIDLPRSPVVALRAHRAAWGDMGALPRMERGRDWIVFCTRDGQPLNWRSVSRAVKALLRRAGLPPVPFHALRQTAATLLITQGVHPKVMQERLGHASAATTLDMYGHFLLGVGRDAAECLDMLLA